MAVEYEIVVDILSYIDTIESDREYKLDRIEMLTSVLECLSQRGRADTSEEGDYYK